MVTFRVSTAVLAKVFTRHRSLVAKGLTSRSRGHRFESYRGVTKSSVGSILRFEWSMCADNVDCGVTGKQVLTLPEPVGHVLVLDLVANFTSSPSHTTQWAHSRAK